MLKFYQISFFVFFAVIAASLVVLRSNDQMHYFHSLNDSQGSGVFFVEESVEASVLDSAQAVNVLSENQITSRSCDLIFTPPIEVQCAWYYPEAENSNIRMPVMVLKPDIEESVKESPIVFIGGGPGEGRQTASEAVLFWVDWFIASDMQRELVIYDPRGNLPGDPGWDCEAYNEFSLDILEKNVSALEEAHLSLPVLEACFGQYQQYLSKHLGLDRQETLNQFSSVQNAKDLVGMMSALGYEEWHVLAVSYGTRVAMLAALDNPQIKSLILDSPYPLDASLAYQEPVLWQKAFDRFWQYCDSQPLCGREGLASRELFWELMAQLKESPVLVPVEVEGRSIELVLNDSRLSTMLFAVFYDEDFYRQIVPALLDLKKDKIVSIKPLVEHVVQNAFQESNNAMVYYATECNDAPVASNAANAQGSADGVAEYNDLQEFELCKNSIFRPGSLPAMKSINIPVLIASGELDPITPLAQAKEIQQHLTQSRLLTVKGAGHAILHAGLCGHEFLEPFLNDPASFGAQLDSGSISMGECL